MLLAYMRRDTPLHNRVAPLEAKFNVGVSTRECDMDAHGDEVAQGEDGLDGVEAWLGAIDVKVGLEDIQHMTTTAAPSTRSVKLLRLPQYRAQLSEEVSPTNTNFSSDPIFDSPYSPTDSSCLSARNRCDYPDTEASSLDEEDEVYARKELLASVERCSNGGVEPLTSATPLDDSPFEPAISGSSPNLVPTATTPPSGGFDPDATHLIYLTSCLQCVLSGLPCSRTLPACSRCKRHGRGDLCLMQRKRHHNEVFGANDIVDTDPILLVSVGDDEGTHKQKFQLQNEVHTTILGARLVKTSANLPQLLKTWKEKQNLKNWAIPANDGIRGDWKTAVLRRVEVHPGVGSGPPTYHRLRVALWHENTKRGRLGG
jgi:hypothetical protein